MMIVVNDIVFSREIWDWYHERRGDVEETRTAQWHVRAFFELLPADLKEAVQRRRVAPITYQSLSAAQFYALLNEVFLLLCDLQKGDKKCLSLKISPEDVERELGLIERMVVFWATTKGHTDERLGVSELDPGFIVDEDGLGLRFAAYAYCMVNAARDGFERAKKVLNGVQPSSLKRLHGHMVRRNEFGPNGENEFDDFMRTIVRMGYGGDFDEFILSVISDIQNKKMGPFHEQFAHIRGYELMGSEKVQEELPAPEIWRRLFNTYFDKEEDNFKLFYSTYTADCAFFIFKDYLHILDNCGITYLPVYGLFSLDGFRESYTDSVRPLIDTARLRRQLLKLYNLKIK